MRVSGSAFAFFCFFASFAPHVVREYARAARDRDAVTAIRIIRELERPLFALVDRAGGNFQSLWRVALELNGIARRGLRHPMATATAEQVVAAVALASLRARLASSPSLLYSRLWTRGGMDWCNTSGVLEAPARDGLQGDRLM